jgi:hypothetical protein
MQPTGSAQASDGGMTEHIRCIINSCYRNIFMGYSLILM